MKKYEGFRENGQPLVLVLNGTGRRALAAGPSQQIIDHAPYGFEWGYGGSGPAQLALAILLDHTRNPTIASRHYQAFKREFIAPAPDAGFTITADQVGAWLGSRTATAGE
ncbi:MAG TPA: DUF6166 domain-containing protein [Verrucomicrobiota bacterium]|nr:DUF6166 domain-containing protein [Verrucomicrobiota bacterium]HNS69501.1 DUF6166 domain-containing protein [Verrucomicrobiota bacterium]